MELKSIQEKKKYPVRKLDDSFLKQLKTGFLKSIVTYVRQDKTLFLTIRENCINIYYRGGNLLNLSKCDANYKASFDTGYLQDKNIIKLLPNVISNSEGISEWLKIFPLLKHEMDVYFSKHPKAKREFQQLVARENNDSSISNSTDYFIADIEYAADGNRFDLLAIKWLSERDKRKETNVCRLALIEMKYGDATLNGKSGIQKHIEDIKKITEAEMDIIKTSAVNCFEQLRELGLIQFSKKGNTNKIEKLTGEKPELILLLANHDPASTVLKKELELERKSQPLTSAELKICTASFMGYGLFDDCMKTPEEIIKLLKK
jgi:hypothetical protein